jgi:hypothetical protein
MAHTTITPATTVTDLLALTDLAAGHGLRTFTTREATVLTADPAGLVLAQMMLTDLEDLQSAIGDAQTAAVRVTTATSDIADHVSMGLHADPTWLTQATGRLVDAVTSRDAAVRSYRVAYMVADKLIDTRVAEAGETR